MNQQVSCSIHRKLKSLICLTEGCNTMLCPDCAANHRSTHERESDQRIMNFTDVLSFSVESQKLFSDSLMAELSNMNESEYYQEVQAKVKVIKNLKQLLRNLIREFFDELARDYQMILMQQQEDFLKGLKSLKSQIQSHYNKSQLSLSVLQQANDLQSSTSNSKFMTPKQSRLKSPGLSGKFKLTTSQIQKDIESDDEELMNQENSVSDTSTPRKSRIEQPITQPMVASVVQTLKEQETMKQHVKRFQQERVRLLEEFHRDRLHIDSELEESFKEFLAQSFYVIKEKSANNGTIAGNFGNNRSYRMASPKKEAITELKQVNNRSPSPINYVAAPTPIDQGSRMSQQFLHDNSISSISLPADIKQPSIQVPQQLKSWENKPLTLNDLDVNTHDYFMKQPFMHFFNLKDNQIVIQYIGAPDDGQVRKEIIPNRARFQSTYLADPNSIAAQQHTKNPNLPSQIFRNIFKGGIEKKTLNSTFAIPHNHRSIALPNREIYMIGGQYDKETVPFVFKYSWEVNQLVEAGKPLGVSRSNFGIAQLNNYIYVVGGYNEKLGTLKSCEIMDVMTKQWSPIADLNVECRDLSVCSFNNRLLYKFGGICQDDQLNEYIEKYEPNTNRWVSFHIQNKNSLRSKFQLYAMCGAVQINSNHMMIFGGSDAGLSEDTDQTFLCEIVGLNKVTISTKGAIQPNPLVQNNRVYAMQLQRDKKGNFHPYKRTMMLYEEKTWKVNH